MMVLSFVVDGLIILLMGVAIGYAVLLNGRLRRLREYSGELEKAVLGLDGSISRADAGLAEIKQAAEGVGRDLDQRVDPARSLVTELGYIVERAETASDRLEKAISQSRSAIEREEAEDKQDARRFARALRPLVEDDHPLRERVEPLRQRSEPADQRSEPLAGRVDPSPPRRERGPLENRNVKRFQRRPFEDDAPQSRGAALVRALRGMR